MLVLAVYILIDTFLLYGENFLACAQDFVELIYGYLVERKPFNAVCWSGVWA